jgi:hypothetical protein
MIYESAVAEIAGSRARWSGVSYAVLVCLLSLSGLASCMAFAQTRFFREECKGKWVGRGDVAFTARGEVCDVLVFGDSTAMTGIDGRVIEHDVGLKTCNIAQTLGVHAVLGLAPLDRFLSNNPAPRFLVLQFAAENLRPPEPWSGAYVEGLYDLIAFYPGAESAAQIASHPDSAFALSQAVASLTLRRVFLGAPDTSTPLDRPRPDVFFNLPKPAEARCDPADIERATRLPDPAFVRQLRARYARVAERLLIVAAPTASCDPRLAQARRLLEGALDGAYEDYPAGLFNEGFVHYTPEGSDRVSKSLAKLLAERGGN